MRADQVFFVLILHTMIATGCIPVDDPPQETWRRLHEVFFDFAYAGMQPLDVEFEPGFEPSEMNDIPDTFLRGYRYIFHRKLPTDDEDLALVSLPRRLTMGGFELVSWPRRASDLMYPVIGGPLFEIVFRFNSQTGIFYSATNAKIAHDDIHSGRWVPHDYVLELR